MARKLNKNLVGALTLAGMLVLALIGVVLIVNLPGQDPKKYEEEAKKLELQGEYERAMGTYVRAYQKSNSTNPDYLVAAARCAIEDGKIAGAIANARGMIDKALIRDAGLRSALKQSVALEFELAKLFGDRGQWRTLMNAARKLLKADQQSPEGNYALGLACLFLREEDEAYRSEGENALKRAVELDPTNVDLLKDYVEHSWALAAERKNSVSAADAAAAAKGLETTLSSAIQRAEEGNQKENAQKLSELRARMLIQKGRAQDGVTLLKAIARDETTTASGHILLGQVYAGGLPGTVEPDLPAAAEAVEKGLAIDPKNTDGYKLLAEIYKRQSRPDDADAVYRRGLEAIPRRDHFRSVRDNWARIEFITELFMNELTRAAAAKDGGEEQKYAASLAKAEEWIDTIKKEVDAQALPVRFMNAQLFKAKGDYVAATREAEQVNRMTGADKHFQLQGLLAELYMRRGEWGIARNALQRALALRPTVPTVWLWMGNVSLELGDPAAALRYLKPTEPAALRNYLLKEPMAIKLRARAYEQLGQFEEARRESQQITITTVDDELFRIERLLAEGDKKEAESRMKQVLVKNPDNVSLVQTLIQFYVQEKRFQDARDFLTERLSKEPQNADWIRLDRLLAASSTTDEAERDKNLLASINAEPDEYKRAVALSDFYRTRKKHDEERQQLDVAERLRPEAPDVLERQLVSALLTKNWDRAEQYVAKSAKMDADGTEGKVAAGRLALARGSALEAEKKTTEAQAEFTKAMETIKIGLDKYPNYSTGWTLLAETHLRLGRQEDARAALDRALNIDPSNGLANRLMAQLALRQGDQKTAESYLAKASRFLPNDVWVVQQQQVLHEKSDPQSGIPKREARQKEAPKDLENLVQLARLYANRQVGEFDKAVETYQQALTLSKNDLELTREYAMFLGQGRPAEGEELLKSRLSAEEDPAKKAQAAVYLAQFYEAQGTLATADRHFRLAVSLDPSVRILILAAEFYSRSNRLRDAQEYYERSLKLLENDPATVKSVRSRIIGLVLAVGDCDQAGSKIAEFTQAYPEDAQGLVFLGAKERICGDIQKAKQAFDAYLSKHPDSALALWQRGQLYMLMGRWQSAIEDLKNAVVQSRDGLNYQHHITLANALVEVRREPEAISHLQKVIDEHPEEQGVAEALADIYLRTRPPRYPDAESLIVGCMRRFPDEIRWPLLLGRMGEQAQDWGRAVQGYQAAAEMVRYGNDTLTKLFRAMKAAGRGKEMIRIADEKVSSQVFESQPEALAGLGWAYVQSGDKPKGFETYDRALAFAKDFRTQSAIVADMGRVFGNEAVLARCEERAKSEPNNILNQEIYAHLLVLTGKTQDALTVCQRLREIAVNNQDVVFALLAQGMLLDNLGRAEEAKAKYEETLKVDPQQSMALNNLAYLLVEKLNRPAEALPYAREAYRRSPNDAGVLDTLGWTLALNNQVGEASGMLLRALEIDRQNAPAHYHLGIVFLRRGEKEDAKQQFLQAQTAAEAQGDNGLLPKIKEALKDLK